MSKKITVDIVDVSNWAHRAYFAARGMRAPDGTPTGVIKILSSMLESLMAENYKLNGRRGTYIACCMDVQTKETFRYAIQHDWVKNNRMRADLVGMFGTENKSKSPEYKGNRMKDPEKAELMGIQMELLETLLPESGIPTFRRAPYEADDMIGSIAHQLEDGYARIQSRDKDFAQLVKDGKTILIMPEQANAPRKEIDYAGCIREFGVKPYQIRYYLQLLGDSVDNIPGVPGVGPKTAVSLLNEFKTLGGIQRNKDKIKGKGRDRKLLRGEERGLPPFDLTAELVKIKTDIEDIPTRAEDYQVGTPSKKFKKMIKKLGFKSLFGS